MELWQAWQRGERATVRPWIGLLVSFCLVLAGMYSFFFFSSVLSNDALGGAIMTVAFVVLLLYLGRRISANRNLSLIIVGFMAGVSFVAFMLWVLVCYLGNWNAWLAIAGTLVLGLLGAFVAVPSLNAIERQSVKRET